MNIERKITATLNMSRLALCLESDYRGAGVYIILCEKDNRLYVGKGKNIVKRLTQHIGGCHVPELKEAIEKHGLANFLCAIYPCDTDEQALAVERVLIHQYRCDASVFGYAAGFNRNGHGTYGSDNETYPTELEGKTRRGRPKGSKTSTEGKARMAEAQQKRREREREVAAEADTMTEEVRREYGDNPMLDEDADQWEALRFIHAMRTGEVL